MLRRQRLPKQEDLADIIVATLSMAAEQAEKTRVDMTDFYVLFEKLQKEFPDVIPAFGVIRSGPFVYSKTLGHALEEAITRGVQIANPRFQFLEVNTQCARRNLVSLERRRGKEFQEELKPVVARLRALLQDSPA